MKLLITGVSQPIGGYFFNYFSRKFDIIPCDTVIEENLVSALPDAVIHAYEISNINYCERNESISYMANTMETKKIACLCSKFHIPLIFISTSHVFCGEKHGPYYEDDLCEPLNVYGKTKLYGEELIRTICEKHFILRTSSIFGVDYCFVKNIVSSNTSPIFQYSNDILSPIYIDDVCELIEKMLTSNHYGIYHCTNDSYLTIEKLTNMILEIAKIKRNIVYIPRSIISNTAKVSKNTALSSRLASINFKIKPLPLEERLNEYINSIIF